jgi:hypothetical protein
MPEMKHSVFGTSGVPSVPKEPEQKENVSLNDLQSLVELGCVRDEIKIGEKTFGLRSLNITERKDLSEFLGNDESEQHIFEFNIKLLAMSVETVNGIPLENFHNNIDLDPTIRKQELISVMQTPVVAKLLTFYNEIMGRCDKQFDLEEVKN